MLRSAFCFFVNATWLDRVAGSINGLHAETIIPNLGLRTSLAAIYTPEYLAQFCQWPSRDQTHWHGLQSTSCRNRNSLRQNVWKGRLRGNSHITIPGSLLQPEMWICVIWVLVTGPLQLVVSCLHISERAKETTKWSVKKSQDWSRLTLWANQTSTGSPGVSKV